MKLRVFNAAGLLLTLFVASGAQAAKSGATSFDAVVTRVVDGDTVWLQDAANRRAKWIKVRIQGIDAPEICQPGGTTSRDALAGRVMDKQVRVSVDGRDDYDRLLARLALSGGGATNDVGAWMVRSGQAWSYRYRWNQGPYAAEQRLAKTTRRGVFADTGAEEPRDFRKRHGPCEWKAR